MKNAASKSQSPRKRRLCEAIGQMEQWGECDGEGVMEEFENLKMKNAASKSQSW